MKEKRDFNLWSDLMLDLHDETNELIVAIESDDFEAVIDEWIDVVGTFEAYLLNSKNTELKMRISNLLVYGVKKHIRKQTERKRLLHNRTHSYVKDVSSSNLF